MHVLPGLLVLACIAQMKGIFIATLWFPLQLCCINYGSTLTGIWMLEYDVWCVHNLI